MMLSWLLCGDRTVASSRLQGYLIHEGICRRGECALDSHLVYAPPLPYRDVPWSPSADRLLARAMRGGVVVFQKMHGPRTERVVRELAGAGVTTVYIQCDFEPENRIPSLCDVVVCPSQEMAGQILAQGALRVECIHDPAEIVWPSPVPPRRAWRGLKVCWVGNGVNFHTLDPVRAILNEEEFRDLELVTISNHPDADVPWSLDAVREVVSTCDLAVVPTGEGDAFRVKSSNRVVLFMAAGIPVVAGDLRSYREVIQHGSTGMLAFDPEAYRAAFRLLRDPEARSRISRQAHEYCLENFTLDHIIDRWITFFKSLEPRGDTGATASLQQSCHLMGVLKAHSALRLSRECWWWDHRVTYSLLREGLGLAVKHPSHLLLDDLVHAPRTAVRAVKQQAKTTRVVAPAYRLAHGCWHALRGLVRGRRLAHKRV
jgi:Glycosyl transferases group 1